MTTYHSLWKKLVTMCKSYSREGIESLVTIGAAVLEIHKKLKGDNKMPPTAWKFKAMSPQELQTVHSRRCYRQEAPESKDESQQGIANPAWR